MSEQEPQNLTQVLEATERSTEDNDPVRVGDILDAFAGRIFGPLLIIPGLMLLTPLGAIPGAPAILGILVAFLAAQRLIGQDRPWVPKRLRDRGIQREKLLRGFEKIRPWTRRVDRVIKPRLTFLTTGRAEYLAVILALLLGATIPAVGLIPFAAMLPGAGLVLIGLALTARDGLLMLAAFGFAAATAYFATLAVM